MSDPMLGITVMPEYAQSEGIEAVLHNIVDVARAGSLTTSPYVAAQTPPGTGHREPPGDGGLGHKRLLDRPLWGARELWMTAAPSFRPDPALYDGLAYRPPAPDALTDAQGAVVGRFVDAAKARGLEVWMQIQAAIPPCYRVQFGGPLPGDEPLMPGGAPRPGRVDRNASLAAPGLRAYVRAITRDLCRAYPQVDGLKYDWPEYPVYHFDALFFDFNPAMAPHAAALGLDLAMIERGTARFLADLAAGRMARTIALDDLDGFRATLLAAYPVLDDLLALRRAVVTDYAAFLRQTVDEASDGRCKLFLHAFPPPLNIATGFDPALVAPHCDAMGVKFYTMHWPLIEAEYLAALTRHGHLAPVQVARALSRILALSPDMPRDPRDIRYPEPGEPHPAASADISAKIAQARALARDTPVWGMAHGYGPTDDVMRRFHALGKGPVQMNRYAYLSDEKLQALGLRQ